MPTARQLRFSLIHALLLRPGCLLLKLLARTWRMDAATRALAEMVLLNPRSVVGIHHGASLPLLPFVRLTNGAGRRIMVLTSPSRDGLLLDAVLHRLGITTIKGSSRSKAVEGLRNMIDALADGGVAVMAVDGPRGPLLVSKPGFLMLAQHTNAPIFACAVAASSSITFGSWDRLFLPLPFARVILAIEPFEAPPDEPREATTRRFDELLFTLARRIDSPITRGITELPP